MFCWRGSSAISWRAALFPPKHTRAKMKITKTGRHKNMTIRGDDKRRLIELGSYAAEHHVDFEAWHALSETDEGIREILKRIDANYCVVIDGWRINYTVDRMKEGLFRHLF